VAEWLKAHAWKACLRETVTWVRIPLPPPALGSLTSTDVHLRPGNKLLYNGLAGAYVRVRPVSFGQSQNRNVGEFVGEPWRDQYIA
jgi:hypothetical protein